MRIVCCLIVASGCTTIDDGFALEIEARDASVVVVKDGDGPWERIATTQDGRAYVQIHDSYYGVGALCSDETWKSATFSFDTQPRSVFLPCPTTIANSQAFHVRGITEPMSTVWLDGRSVRADAMGRFDLQLFEPGLHDVMAILPTMPPKIVAHRAIVISSDTTVDLPATNALEMIGIFPTVLGKPDEIELSSDLNTGTDWISFGSSDSTVYVPPAEFLLPTDRPAVAARAGGCTRQHTLATANEPFELPRPLEYTLDRAQLQWTADPEIPWDGAMLYVDSAAGGRYSAYASAIWRETTGASAIPIVDLAGLPGWNASLPQLLTDKPASFGLYVSRGAYDRDLTSCGANEQIARW